MNSRITVIAYSFLTACKARKARRTNVRCLTIVIAGIAKAKARRVAKVPRCIAGIASRVGIGDIACEARGLAIIADSVDHIVRFWASKTTAVTVGPRKAAVE